MRTNRVQVPKCQDSNRNHVDVFYYLNQKYLTFRERSHRSESRFCRRVIESQLPDELEPFGHATCYTRSSRRMSITYNVISPAAEVPTI